MQDHHSDKLQGRTPKGAFFIIVSEIAERFSFYGMSGILSIYLVAQFFNPAHLATQQTLAQAKANELYHLFVTVAYFTPLVGALMADWFFGKYKVILYVSLFYCVGHLILAIFDKNLDLFKLGMLLIAMGAGGIKSNVSAALGDQFTKDNQHLMSKIFGWFYFATNTGSVLANFSIPLVNAWYGPKWAFGIPGAFMALATLIFYLGRKTYTSVAPSGIKKDNIGSILLFMLKCKFKRHKEGLSVVKQAEERFSESAVEGVLAVGRVLKVLIFMPIFWALYYQSLSEWVLQAQKLDLHLFNFSIFHAELRDYTLLPAQVQMFNAFFILITVPLFAYVLYPRLEKWGVKCTPLRKIGAGLFLCLLAFVLISLLQQEVDSGLHPSVWWQIVAYVLMTCSETLIVVTFIEYAYTQSPPNMKSTMTAIWWLSLSVGNLFPALVNASISKKNGLFSSFIGARYYWLFSGVMAVFFVIYLFVSPFFKEKSYIAHQ